MPSRGNFPPPPYGLKGRATELATLARTIEAAAPTRLALVGAGGSGKSMLACALGHRLARRFDGRIHWLRVGAWDFRTLVEMLAHHVGTSRERSRLVPELQTFLASGGERLVVLDNHEDDHALARLLDTFAATPTTFVVTARRCLLSGILVFPVAAPLVISGRSAFPAVAPLTRLLRWNPLALDIASALVSSRAATVGELARFLTAHGVSQARVVENEDDLPEVALLVDWAWRRLGSVGRRMLAVLSYVDGDHVSRGSLAELSRARSSARPSLDRLQQWHLVQEPIRARFAVHAVVRHAVRRKAIFSADAIFEHYMSLLERSPGQLVREHTHLFAAMDHAHRSGDLATMLRVDRLLSRLDADRT